MVDYPNTIINYTSGGWRVRDRPDSQFPLSSQQVWRGADHAVLFSVALCPLHHHQYICIFQQIFIISIMIIVSFLPLFSSFPPLFSSAHSLAGAKCQALQCRCGGLFSVLSRLNGYLIVCSVQSRQAGLCIPH